MSIAVIGAGSWGTALAHTLVRTGEEVRLWARSSTLAAEIVKTRRNPIYMSGVELDPAVMVTSELDVALVGADIVVVAVPTHGMREIVTAISPYLGDDAVVVSAAKGFELTTRMTMTEVLGDVLGGTVPVAALSGPNIAPEIARGLHAATVVAATDPDVAERIRDRLNGSPLRVYSSVDTVGVEYGGALKNVVAIAAGVCDGIGAGDNGKAAIITRGLAEMARLGVSAGAEAITFAGLTGLGDCIVTCASPHSRNRRLGEALGRGVSVEQASSGAMVFEGVNATRVAMAMARQRGIDMPIAEQVHAILFESRPIAGALIELMSRGAVAEMRGLGLDRLDSSPSAAGSSSGG